MTIKIMISATKRKYVDTHLFMILMITIIISDLVVIMIENNICEFIIIVITKS